MTITKRILLFSKEKRQAARLVIQLIQIRKKKGLTQKELAHKIGMTQAQIARLETLDVIPKIDTIFRILEGLEVSLEICSKQKKSKDT